MKDMIIYPGSFDPITLGHFDLIQRAARMTDHLVVAVLQNPNKKGFFTVEERVEMLKICTKDMPNVSIDSSGGLLVDYINKKGGKLILRGLRAVSDFEYELQYAMLNQRLDKSIEAIYLMTASEYSFLSSSVVREIGHLGGDISGMVPEAIVDTVKQRLLLAGKQK
ncbi:MAG: pantetheine-phosphate adenylyltransferase [Clostridia bacterium]|nr:pantetheine-phosphate adenylyltransferase [Clostridia bacterium]